MLRISRGAAITASLALVALCTPIASAQPSPRVAAVMQGLPRFAGCKTVFSRSVSGVVRPRSIMLACGDGAFYLTRVAWTNWGMRQALGVGVGHQNDCVPDCASGHFHTYRVSVKLPQFTHQVPGEEPMGAVPTPTDVIARSLPPRTRSSTPPFNVGTHPFMPSGSPVRRFAELQRRWQAGMCVTEDDALIQRYYENYGCSATLTAEQVRYHLRLETELTARLLASTGETRWATFQECYDELYGSLPWLVETGGVGDLERWAQVIGPPPQRLYEVGSGDGGLARALAALGYEVVATDISVHRGRERREAAGLTWGVTDGVHLDRFTEPEAYDVVISDQLVEHLHPDDLGEHLRGCRSILRPGGRYLVQTPHAFTGPHDVSCVFGYEEPVGMHLREYTTAELKRELRRAGFSSVQSVLRLPGGKMVASPLHLGYLGVVERTLRDAPRATRKAVSLRLRGPLRPRIFLVAHR